MSIHCVGVGARQAAIVLLKSNVDIIAFIYNIVHDILQHYFARFAGTLTNRLIDDQLVKTAVFFIFLDNEGGLLARAICIYNIVYNILQLYFARFAGTLTNRLIDDQLMKTAVFFIFLDNEGGLSALAASRDNVTITTLILNGVIQPWRPPVTTQLSRH